MSRHRNTVRDASSSSSSSSSWSPSSSLFSPRSHVERVGPDLVGYVGTAKLSSKPSSRSIQTLASCKTKKKGHIDDDDDDDDYDDIAVMAYDEDDDVDYG